jgi:cyclase
MIQIRNYGWMVIAAIAITTFMTQAAAQEDWGGMKPPDGWIPPPLGPAGVRLETKELGPGVYALLSDRPPVDNSGFIVGERGVLVIDAHINAAMAGQIQAAVRRVTDKPILYLVNTNYHGDHTFGNYAFPAETTIIAHSKTAEAMRDFEGEKALLLPAVGGDRSVFGDVRLRLPDLTFEDSMHVDLGDRVVDLLHFGHGNTPGDTVVYEPTEKVAWTGNLILGEGSIPWAIDGHTRAYRDTIERFSKLDVELIIPGHILTSSSETTDKYIRYLDDHISSIEAAVRSGLTLEQTLAALPLDEFFLPPSDSPLSDLRPIMQGLHRWNVKKTWLELKAEIAP